MDSLLTDLVPFDGDKETLLLWDNFTNPVSNCLQRMLSRLASDKRWLNGISHSHLVGIKLTDLMDTQSVGQLRKSQIIEELVNVFAILESQESEDWVATSKEYVEEEQTYAPDAVDLAINLDELVKAIISTYNDYRVIDDRTLAILRSRIPALLSSKRTLEDIGNEFNITRERVRQIERKFLDLQLATVKEENLVTRWLIEILEVAENEQDFIDRAKDRDLLGNEPISLEKLKAIAGVLGNERYLSRVELVESMWDSKVDARSVLAQKARESRHKFGLIDLNSFIRENRSSDFEAYRAIKSVYPRSIRAGNLVLARTSKLDTTFENILGKQLKAFSELSAENLLIGVERHAYYRQTPLIGSLADQVALIKEITGQYPNYTNLKSNTLEEPILSLSDTWLLEIFRDSPTGMLHRNEITAAALRDGKNVSSVGIFLIYNPLVRPAGLAVMTLANQTIDSEFARQYANIARAAEAPTTLEFEFEDSNIVLRFVPNLNTMMAGVLFPKAELRAMIKDHSFDVECQCGRLNSTQQLRLRDPSFWTGFSASIKHLKDDHFYAKGAEVKILLDFNRLAAVIRTSEAI